MSEELWDDGGDYSAEAVKRTSGLAMASLAFALPGLFSGCVCFLAPFPVMAIVLGFMALHKISRDPEHLLGRGLALSGVVTGMIGLVLAGGGILYVILMSAGGA